MSSLRAGIVVPHASGARVIVGEVHVCDAYNTTEHGVPAPAFFDAFVRERTAHWPHHALRAQPIAASHRTPRWLVVAACVAKQQHEASRDVVFAWWSNDPFTMRVEELLVSGIANLSLTGDMESVAPDTKRAREYAAYATSDGGRVYLDSIALRFAFEGAATTDALQELAPVRQPWLQVQFDVDADAAVLAFARFNSAALKDRGPPEPGETYDTAVLVGWIAPALGDATLSSMLTDVCARFHSNELTLR